MTALRQPAVAGLFYPREREALLFQLDRLMAGKVSRERVPKAIIAPHAGLPFSGATAAEAYAQVEPVADQISRVVLLGPAHRVPLYGLAAPSVEAFVSPLGEVTLDRAKIDELLELPQVVEMDRPHDDEHSLEVHLPFLQRLIPAFDLIPLVVGDAKPEEVADVLERCWGGPETLVIISSDLSHFLDDTTARERDGATSRHIEQLEYESIGYEDACGRNPINGLLALARKRGLRVEQLDYSNSGDTAGDRSRVVGYGAYGVYETAG